MEVSLAVIADSANISGEGKLNVLGIFDSLGGSSFPIHHPSATLAFQLRAEYDDSGRKHEISVTLIDEDHRQLWGAGLLVEVGEIPPGEFVHINQVINFAGLSFESPGRYTFRFTLGDRHHSVPFKVNQITEGNSPLHE